MKTTDQTSARSTASTPAPHWSRVRPALRWTLVLSVAAWLGLISEDVLRLVRNQDFLENLARFATQDASAILTTLAAVSVAAVFVERARTTGSLRKLRQRLARSWRVTQRLGDSSRTARA